MHNRVRAEENAAGNDRNSAGSDDSNDNDGGGPV